MGGNIFSNIVLGEKVGKKSVVVVILNFLAVAGQFRPFQILRFAVTFQTVHIPSRTELCSPNFGPPKFSVFCVPKIALDRGGIFRLSIFGGFPGSGTAPGGFYGKFQYRTTRFCSVS